MRNKKSGADLAQSGAEKKMARGKLGRDHIDYWKARLFRRSYKWKGEAVEIPEFQIRLSYLGRREEFNLGTANETSAATKAREIYRALTGKGWVAAMEIYKPDMLQTSDGCTVGQYLDTVQAVASHIKRKTFEVYAKKFRSLVSDICRIDGGQKKFDYVNGGAKEWVDRIRAVKLERISPEAVEAWKKAQLGSVANDGEKYSAMVTTVRSIMLNSKALFSRKKVLKHKSVAALKLPDRLPFHDVEIPEEQDMRYESEINIELLAQSAQSELAEAKPELFKIFLLSLGAGLRRKEIDTLQWSQMLWHENKIFIKPTQHASLKSKGSKGKIKVDPGTMDLLKAYMPAPGEGGEFVIQSCIKPRPDALHYHYRCNRIFKDLIKWLQSKGVNSRKPLHCMRKEFGVGIYKQNDDIFAASVALRHSSIAITRSHYADDGAVTKVFPLSKMFATKAA